ncbi:MAG: PDZ domain-containing protein [Armatimonadetes bacterium]|nr:MAG: PDZ domain-containing protein [Armatimonadota bacterium]
MDSPTHGTELQDPFDTVPPSMRPPAKYPKWPFYLAGSLVAVGIAIAILLTITLPYYAVSPGPVYDTSDFVTVDGGHISENGELFFLTVSLKEANVFEWAAAQLDERVELAKVEAYRPPDVSEEQLRRESLALMSQSKQDAIYVALTKLGYEVTLIGTGALVIDTIPDSAADGVLEPNDIIIEMDGETVAFRSDVLSILAPKSVGDPVRVTVERIDGETDEFEVDDFELILGPHTDDPPKPMMGVLLDNNEPIVEFPVDVQIDSQNIGGPSAGLMFTLQIMDQLTPEPLTHGKRIAGTGSIHLDETVGAIGGIHQKVFGAIDAGAVAVLVPAGNYDEAVVAAAGRITVVRVETVDDALEFLETL